MIQQRLCIIIFVLLFVFPNSVFAMFGKKDAQIVDWVCPVPRFPELNLKLKNIDELIDDGQLILLLQPEKIRLWTKGKIKEYDGVRFSSAMAVIEQPPDIVRQRIMSIDGALKALPQLKKIEVMQISGNHILVSFVQEYDVGVFTLKSPFVMQYTVEDNGDMTGLLHKGDVDAGVMRIEFLKITDKKTLLVMSFWQDLDSAGFFYRLIINGNPDLKMANLPIAASIFVQSFKTLFQNESGTDIAKRQYKGTDDIPLFTTKPELKNTLFNLAQIGTPTFIHPELSYNDHDKEKTLLFATSIQVYPAKISKTKPYVWDMKQMPEYISQFDKVTETQHLDDGKVIDIRLKYGVGLMNVKLDMAFDYKTDVDHIGYIENPKGDILFIGAEELFEVQSESGHYSTIQAFTSGTVIGDGAPWIIRYLQRSIPQADLIRNVGFALSLGEHQLPWLLDKLNNEKTLMSAQK